MNSIGQAKQENDKAIELAMALKKLKTDKDFGLIYTEYTQNYILYLHKQMAMYNNNSDEFTELVTELKSVSYFIKFLQTITDNGAMALASNDELNAILQESDDDE